LKRITSKEIKKSIRTVPNFPKKGVMFRDITTLLNNKKIFKRTIDKIVNIVKKKKINKIAGIDSRGFIFAAPVAYRSNLPLILVRKQGKLPSQTYKMKYSLEYGFDALEINKESIKKNDKVMVIDDLIATGGTAIASAKLISKNNIKKIEFFFLVELQDLPGVSRIKEMGHNVTTLCKFKENER